MQVETEQKTPLTKRAAFRATVLVICIVVLFVAAKQLTKPKSFGQYGYYRGDNVTEWMAMTPSYAPPGNKECIKCHADIAQTVSQAQHGKQDCQSCHGPLMEHVRKPNVTHPKVVGNAELCGACHRELIGRTKEQITTIKVGEHSGGLDCVRCHNPHQPLSKIGGRP